QMLIVPIRRDGDDPIYAQIYEGIRRVILDGSLTVGTKLPSKRKFSEHLGVSNTIIELAYEQLLAEGYITSKPRSGFYVQDVGELAYAQPAENKKAIPVPTQEKTEYRYDFSPGR